MSLYNELFGVSFYVSSRSLRAVDQVNIPSARTVVRYKLFSTELHNSVLWRKINKLKSMKWSLSKDL